MSFTLCRAMLQFADPVDQMAAVLHDVVEDTACTLDDLRDAGYRPEVVDAIDALTHHFHDSYERYIENVARNPVARRVKIIDLEENLSNNWRSPLPRGTRIGLAATRPLSTGCALRRPRPLWTVESKSECGFHCSDGWVTTPKTRYSPRRA